MLFSDLCFVYPILWRWSESKRENIYSIRADRIYLSIYLDIHPSSSTNILKLIYYFQVVLNLAARK